MFALVILVFMKLLFLFKFSECTHLSEDSEFKPNTVMIAVFIRNKQHTLPYFLSCLERLEYPKKRISLWLVSDNNEDKSNEVLKRWLEEKGDLYHSFRATLDDENKSDGGGEDDDPFNWTQKRYQHIIDLREEALKQAKPIWADFILMLDADALLTDATSLSLLVSKGLPVVAPLLHSDGLYSNFWGGMSPEYYYRRTDDYLKVLRGDEGGCHSVPMVHSAVLIDLRRTASDLLTYSPNKVPGYQGPFDDIIAFAISANKSGIPLHVCNDVKYGYIMIPLEKGDTIDYDVEQLRNLQLEMLYDNTSIEVSPELFEFVKIPRKHPLPVDDVRVINLLRRKDRREAMNKIMWLLQIDFRFSEATDGREINPEMFEELGIRRMPDYMDPYHKRPMKMGEIGCFLSHYQLWMDLSTSLKPNNAILMVLEDDVRFDPFFNQKLNQIVLEASNLPFQWDLIYLGRKKMHEDEEEKVSQNLVVAGYSYWTIGYLVSKSGADKMVTSRPLENILPVDEFIPILSDKHPREDWKVHFKKRDLIVLSASPLILYPIKYVNEEGYVSDTEDSPIVDAPPSKNIHIKLELK